MALPVLDGNQSATTLSSVVTGGEHIVAHSVVSLGATAIANITTAVSGINIGGTVTANISGTPSVTFGAITGSASIIGTPAVTIPQLNKVIASVATDGVADATTSFVKIGGHQDGQNQVAHIVHVSAGGAMKVDASDSSVTFGAVHGTVTISNFPSTQTIAGTVTANIGQVVGLVDGPNPDYGVLLGMQTGENEFKLVGHSGGLPIRIQEIGFENGQISVTSAGVPVIGTITIGNSVTIGSLPAISGTVTANSIFPRVTLIDSSGTVATANTAITVFASSSTRSYLLVQVTTGSAFVNVGATATTVNGINLTAGQGYSWETTIPQGIVSLISTTTSSRYVAKEA